MSDTPKTDAEAVPARVLLGFEVVHSNFARAQERTITKLVEKLSALEVAANTTDYCYRIVPKNFAMALKSLTDAADKARLAVADATREHWCCEKGKALNVAVCPECLESFGRIPE